MNREEAKILMSSPIFKAFSEDKDIQIRLSSGKWESVYEIHPGYLSQNPDRFRIKPEPQLRAWKPEEVPVGALIRGFDYKDNNWKSLLTYVDDKGFRTADVRWNFNEATTAVQYSTDGGKTWNPCGVME